MFRLVFESHDGRAPGADSEEKHEPVSDIYTVAVDSLKVLDPNRPIREADIIGLFIGEYFRRAHNALMDLRLALRLLIIGIAITYFLAAIFWYWRMI